MIVKSNEIHSTSNGKLTKIIDENDIKDSNELHKNLLNNNTKQKTEYKEIVVENNDKPLTINIEINSIAWLLFAVGFAFRFYRLSEPSSVVYVLF